VCAVGDGDTIERHGNSARTKIEAHPIVAVWRADGREQLG
jgi:hypothetical protein